MNKKEFKAKILPHYVSMFRVAVSIMESEDEAADVVQDSMLKLYEMRNSFSNISDVKSYCNSVVRNACLNRMRSRKPYLNIEEIANVSSDEDIQDNLEWQDLADTVEKAMNRLSIEQKKVFMLSVYGGFSNAEIADFLGITTGNVRVILSRTRTRIKELLLKH